MKTLIYILLLLFVLPFSGLAQQDSLATTKPEFKNQINLDAQFLGVYLGYKRRIDKNWFVGAKISALSFTNYAYQENISVLVFETFNFHSFLQYSIKNNVFVEFGPVFSMTLPRAPFVGVGAGIYFRLNKLQLGIRAKVGWISYGNNLFSSPLIIVRIPLKTW